MRRRFAMARALGMGMLLGLAAPRTATAQAQANFFVGQAGDTAVGAVPDTEFQLSLRANNFYCSPLYFCYYYLRSGRLTFYFDAAKLEVAGVVPVSGGWNVIADTSRGTGSFTVSANGYAYGYEVEVLRLRVKLLSGVTDGAYLWARTDSVQFQYYFSGTPFSVNGTSSVGQVCFATEIYGDVDGNTRVDSRDALITLSAAVGLPVSGFNLPIGDVDRDGLTNSRDALMMLSYAISLPIYTANRIGQGVPSACPPLGTVAEKVVFRRQFAEDTLYVLDAGVATPIPNATGRLAHPRLANDGVSVAYQCLDTSSYPQICRINTDGTGFAQLTSGFNYSEAPDWSPDGTMLSLRFNGYPYTMTSSGTGLTQRGSNYMSYVAQAAWSRTGTQLAYNSSGIRVVGSDGTNDLSVSTGLFDIAMIRWSPAGDSLAFTRTAWDGLSLVASAGGTATVAMTLSTLDYFNGFDWGPPGFVFSLSEAGRAGIWYLSSPTAPIVRLTGRADFDPAFRRNP